MRYLICLGAAGLLTACSFQQQGGDLRAIPGPLFSDPPWRISQQFTSPEGERVCTVSKSEMDVTQALVGPMLQQQVGTSTSLSPGDSYKVLIGANNYETRTPYFSPADSRAILDRMQNAPYIYTELTRLTLVGRHERLQPKRWTNKIHMAGFREAYEACSQFIRP